MRSPRRKRSTGNRRAWYPRHRDQAVAYAWARNRLSIGQFCFALIGILIAAKPFAYNFRQNWCLKTKEEPSVIPSVPSADHPWADARETKIIVIGFGSASGQTMPDSQRSHRRDHAVLAEKNRTGVQRTHPTDVPLARTRWHRAQCRPCLPETTGTLAGMSIFLSPLL